jgi:hypothetical protein
MKGVNHYKKDGTLHKSGSHKMPDGTLLSGKTHSKSSVRLFHLKELPATIQKKIKQK